ncbi:MAG: LOG family protein [Candidatus Kryptonium sp.]
MSEKVVTIFGSSKPVEGEDEYEFARKLGYELGKVGFIICNGGYGGTMEATSRGAREAGAKTIGVTVSTFEGSANRWVEEEIKAKDLFERLRILIEKGDAYVVLRGGTGTLVELSLVWELMNKGLIELKPFVAVNFWTPIVETISKQLQYELRTNAIGHIKIINDVDGIVGYLKSKLLY